MERLAKWMLRRREEASYMSQHFRMQKGLMTALESIMIAAFRSFYLRKINKVMSLGYEAASLSCKIKQQVRKGIAKYFIDSENHVCS